MARAATKMRRGASFMHTRRASADTRRAVRVRMPRVTRAARLMRLR
jgi:hypothetical protein